MERCDVSSKHQQRKDNIELPEINATRWNIIKIFAVLCISQFLLAIPVGGVFTLQSTMNQHESTGVTSLGIYYAAKTIASILLSKYLVRKFGCKITLQISMLGFISFIAANYHFTWLVLIPTAIASGISSSVLWTAIGVYINQLVVNYCCIVHRENDSLTSQSIINSDNKLTKKIEMTFPNKSLEKIKYDSSNRFQYEEKTTESDKYFRSLFMKLCLICSHSQIKEIDCTYPNKKTKQNSKSSLEMLLCRNVVLPYINLEGYENLQQNPDFRKRVSWMTFLYFGIFEFFYRTADTFGNVVSYYVFNVANTTKPVFFDVNCTCGSHFCNNEPTCFENNLAEPEQNVKDLLTSTYVVIAASGTLVLYLGLSKLDKDKEPVAFSFDLILSTCMFIRKKDAWLLIFGTLSIGLLEGFYNSDYSKSFVACSWGVHHVSLVTISFATISGVSSFCSGLLVKQIGRITVIVSGFLTTISGCIFCLWWLPDPSEWLLYFYGASIWGIGHGILSSQIKAYYGIRFKKDEAAYAACLTWISLGQCLSYAYSDYLCTYVKIYTILIVVILGLAGYLQSESICCCKKTTN